jgi:phosphotransferase system HPr-like phosphotransfer protein
MMRSKDYSLDMSDKKAIKQMKEIIQIACSYMSSVMIENENKRLNGKSIMKISEIKKGEQFHLIIEGIDEQEAMSAFDELFAER